MGSSSAEKEEKDDGLEAFGRIGTSSPTLVAAGLLAGEVGRPGDGGRRAGDASLIGSASASAAGAAAALAVRGGKRERAWNLLFVGCVSPLVVRSIIELSSSIGVC